MLRPRVRPKRPSTGRSRCRSRVPTLAEVKDAFDRSVMPKLGPTPHYVPPRFERRALSNGLELLIVERHELPIVTFDLIVKSGETSTPQGKEGLGSIAASLLDEGTKTRDSLQIAGEQAEIGAALAAAGELESTTVSLTTLTRHLERGLDLYADIILNPSFPEKELHRLKLQRLAQLKARADDAEQTADAVFPRLIYGLDHPYGRPDDGTPSSVQSITRDDAVAFYKRIMVPGNAALVVVGDIRPDTITAALEARLRTWSPGPVPQAPSVAPPASPPRHGRLPDRQAGRRPVGLEGRQDRRSPQIARFLRLESDERDPGGPIRQPDQSEPSRGQGLQLRGASRASRSCEARARSRRAPRFRPRSPKSRWSRS